MTSIHISRGLRASHKSYTALSPEKAVKLLDRHHDCYELTLPITEGTEVLVPGTNRPYLDLDGTAPAEWDEDTFTAFVDDLCGAIDFVLKGQLKLPYCLLSASQHASVKGNKLSFHIIIQNKHGSRDAVKRFVLDLVPTLRAGLDMVSLITTGEDDPSDPNRPTLTVDTSIYNTNRKIRCYGSSKDDEVRPFVSITDGCPEDSFITLIPDGCEALPEAPPPPPPPSVPDDAVSTDTEPVEDAPETKVELLRQLLSHLHAKRVDVRDYWIKMGFALFNEGVPVDVWVEASKRSPKFVAGECEKLWGTMTHRNLTQSILWLWLREDNPTKYAELGQTRTDFWALLRDPVAFPTARFFANCRPDQYLYHPDLGWFQKRPSCAWQLFKKGDVPDGLTRDIWTTYGRIAREHIAHLNKESEDDKKKIAAAMEIASAAGTRKFVSDLIWALPSFYTDEDLVKKMDESRHLFAFTDKVVDLETMEVRPIAPHDYISITTGYAYPKQSNPGVRKELMKMLWSIWEDDEMVEFVLLTIALCLYGANVSELFYFWKGKGGNGKGLLATLLERVFGAYYHSVPIQVFTFAADRKDATNDHIVNSKGKRMVMSQEPEGEAKIQGGFIKGLSGGDPVTARGIYARPITFVPQFGVFIQMNPNVLMTKADDAVRRRLVVVPFPFQFRSQHLYTGAKDERKADAELKQRLAKDDVYRDEFVLMLLEAYRRLPKKRAELRRPQMVVDATEEYLSENNPLKTWLWAEFERADEKDKRYWWQSAEMRQEFLQYTGSPESLMSAVKFAEYMVLNGITKHQQTNNFVGPVETTDGWRDEARKAGTYWVGLKRKARVEA